MYYEKIKDDEIKDFNTIFVKFLKKNDKKKEKKKIKNRENM